MLGNCRQLSVEMRGPSGLCAEGPGPAEGTSSLSLLACSFSTKMEGQKNDSGTMGVCALGCGGS